MVKDESQDDGYREVTRAEYQAALRQIEAGGGRESARAAETAGHYLYNRRDFKAAGEAFLKVIGGNPGEMLAGSAQFMLGKCFFEMEDYAAALSAFNKVVGGYRNRELLNKARKFIELIIEVKLSLEDLKLIEENYRGKAFYPRVLFQLGKSQYHLGDCEQALRYLGEFLTLYPTNSRFEEVKWMLEECRGVLRSSGRKIGCLLPLSGSLSSSGEMMRHGVELAVEEYNRKRRPKSRIILLVEDTAGDHLRALNAARRLIREEKVSVLIGPASSECLSTVATMVNEDKVPLVTPSAGRLGLSSLSKYIFRNHLIISEEGRLLARYAVEEMGLKRFAIVAPDNYYGKSISEAFRAEVVRGGGEVVLEEHYPSGAKQFKQQMTALGGIDPGSIKQWRRFSEEEFDRAVYNLKMKLLSAPIEEGLTLAVNAFEIHGRRAEEMNYGRTMARRLIAELKREKKLKVLGLSQVEQARQAANIQVRVIDDLAMISDILELGGSLSADLVAVGEIYAEGWEEEEKEGEREEEPAGEEEALAETAGAEGLAATAASVPEKPYEETQFEVNMQVVDVKHGEIILTVNESFTLREVNAASREMADAVFIPAYAAEVILLAPMLKHYNLDMQVLGNGQWGSPEVRQLSPQALEGVIFLQGFFATSEDPIVRSFVEVFEEKYGVKPDQYAAQAYDAGRLVVKALKGSGGSRAKMTQLLSRTRDFHGVSGTIVSFNENGDAEKKLPILEIRRRRIVERTSVED